MEAQRILSRAKAIELGEKFYFTGKPCPHGHIAQRYVTSYGCVSCSEQFAGDKDRLKYMNDWYAKQPKNPKKAPPTPSELASRAFVRKWKKRRADAAYRAANAETVKAYRDEYYKNNKEKIKVTYDKYVASGKAKILVAARHKKRKANDPNYVAAQSIRGLLHKTLDRANIKKTSQTYLMLGYGHIELKQHLESLFLDGMTWQNRSEWHIDHIIPVVEFVRLGITDAARICALPNLRPIWAKDNMAKKDSFELTPYDPHLRKVVKAA